PPGGPLGVGGWSLPGSLPGCRRGSCPGGRRVFAMVIAGRPGSVRAPAGFLGAGLALADPFVEEGFEDALAQPFLQLEEDPDPGEVDAPVPGQVTDPQDPPDVVLAVKTNVRRCPRGTEQSLVLVDPQRARMHADDLGRHANDVDGPRRVSLQPALHPLSLAIRCFPEKSGRPWSGLSWRPTPSSWPWKPGRWSSG